jgi:hypothetical protein
MTKGKQQVARNKQAAFKARSRGRGDRTSRTTRTTKPPPSFSFSFCCVLNNRTHKRKNKPNILFGVDRWAAWCARLAPPTGPRTTPDQATRGFRSTAATRVPRHMQKSPQASRCRTTYSNTSNKTMDIARRTCAAVARRRLRQRLTSPRVTLLR